MRLLLPLFLLSLSLFFPSTTSTLATAPLPILILLDQSTNETHSLLLSEISSFLPTAPIIKTISATTGSVTLYSDGSYIYSGILLLCPRTKSLAKKLPLKTLTSFIDAGYSVFITASEGYSDYISKISNAVGVDIDGATSRIIDHQRFIEGGDKGDHTLVQAGGGVKSDYLFGGYSGEDVIYSGPGATVFKDNELVDGVIWGSGSCYAGSGKMLTRVPRVVGSGCVMAATLQGRSGGRVGWFGGYDVMADGFLEKYERHGGAVVGFLKWAFGEGGRLKIGKVKHWRVQGDGVREGGVYRVGDLVRVEIEVFLKREDGKWGVFESEDLQMEFSMMDVWVRRRLKLENGVYVGNIRMPETIGVYKFGIGYFRKGMGWVEWAEEVSVRPYLHNEYERFIGMAGVYYLGCLQMLVGVFVMGLVVMWGGEGGEHEKRE